MYILYVYISMYILYVHTICMANTTLQQMFPFFYGGLKSPCVGQKDQTGLYNVTDVLRRCGAFPDSGALGSLHRQGYRLAFSHTVRGAASVVRSAPWDHFMPYIGGGAQ